MDYADAFQNQFVSSPNYVEKDVDLFGKLQDTRNALQESLSENDQLSEIIEQLYSESRVEQVATTELLALVSDPLFKNIPLPRNADHLPMSEKAGYTVYYLKFLGFALRKTFDEYQTTKEHLEGMHKSVQKNTVKLEVKRTGKLKVPELDGLKESKRSQKPTAPATPPTTPPKEQKRTNK